jgi:hypothetical protein
MVEGVDRLREIIGTVLQKAEIKPALGPVGLELFSLAVELNGQGKVLLIAGGGGAGGNVCKLRRLFPLVLGAGAFREGWERNKQQENAYQRGHKGPWHWPSATRGVFCDGC